MSKFLLNLLVQISKALVYSKIQFLFRKEFSSDFGPSGPASPVLACFALLATVSTLIPFGLSSLGIFAKRCISFHFAHPGNDAFSLTPLPCGPRLSASSPSPRRPISVTSPPLLTASVHPASPGLQHQDANRSVYSPALIPPFNPPLNPSLSHPAFNGIKAITAGRFPLPRPGVPLPSPYKRRAPPSGFTGPLPASLRAQAPPAPCASSAGYSPLTPGHFCPSATPSCSW
jgi:hypothetical protein